VNGHAGLAGEIAAGGSYIGGGDGLYALGAGNPLGVFGSDSAETRDADATGIHWF